MVENVQGNISKHVKADKSTSSWCLDLAEVLKRREPHFFLSLPYH